MTKICYFFFLISFLSQTAFSQQVQGTCGVSAYDAILIKQRMLENREEWKNKMLQRNGAPVYIPVSYWLTATDNGAGRIQYKNVIDNLCCMNKLYSEFGISFYLKGMFNVNNSYIYDDPSSTLGAAYINQIMLGNKNAVNIFVTNVANAGEPGVLAYYNPQGDYIVCSDEKLNGSCSTLAHEMGHFFSLPHTFHGWEDTDYNAVTTMCTKTTPLTVYYRNTNILVEFVDRNKPGTVTGKNHCGQSADGFCDTPADYRLGFGWAGCNYTACAKDPDNVKLDPSEINLMGYFLDCLTEFTQEQKDAITKDMLSSKRNYLRAVNYTPKFNITDEVVHKTPTMGSPAVGYDTIKFDWEDVPNADYYIFDLALNTGFNLQPISYILKHSDTTLTTLKKNTTYFWRVTAYNTNSFCVVPKIISFRSPAWTVSNENIEDENISSYISQPNENELYLNIDNLQAKFITLEILNSNGQLLKSKNLQLNIGENKIQLDQQIAGLYFYRIINENRKMNTGKFIKL